MITQSYFKQRTFQYRCCFTSLEHGIVLSAKQNSEVSKLENIPTIVCFTRGALLSYSWRLCSVHCSYIHISLHSVCWKELKWGRLRINITLSIAAVQEYKCTCIRLRLQTIVHFIALKRTGDDTQVSSRGAYSVSSWNYCVYPV